MSEYSGDSTLVHFTSDRDSKDPNASARLPHNITISIVITVMQNASLCRQGFLTNQELAIL